MEWAEGGACLRDVEHLDGGRANAYGVQGAWVRDTAGAILLIDITASQNGIRLPATSGGTRPRSIPEPPSERERQQ